MSDNPDKNTVGSDHKRPMDAAIESLQKMVAAAKAINKDDPTTIELGKRFERMKEEADAIKPGVTQMKVYEGLKEKVRRALAEFPKLAKEVKKPGEAPVEVKVVYGSTEVKKACDKDHNCAARIDEVANHGFGYVGHKAVSAIKAHGHVHVGNKNGIAFSWKNKATLEIVGYGTKNDKAKSGNSGYDWVI